MVKIVWTDDAIEDLSEIFDYISKDSPPAAKRLANKLIQKVDVLVNFPKSGRIVPEFQDEQIRELIQGNYRIVYHLQSEIEIHITRIHHSARNISN